MKTVITHIGKVSSDLPVQLWTLEQVLLTDDITHYPSQIKETGT